jgi:NADPH:quinone reductase-like Zn-dependent oxidoreductase
LVREAVPRGADGLVDAALLNELVVAAVHDGGRIATLRGFKGEEKRGITFHPVLVRSYAREQAKLDRLRQQVEEGRVTLRVARVIPAARAAEAHRIFEAGGTRGRFVLEF